MDSAMRDLEQIREQNGEGRPIALVLVMVAVTAGLVVSVGSLLAGFGEGDAAEDPIAALDVGALAASPPQEGVEPEGLPEIDRTQLAFPETLTPPSSNEMAASMAAAAAELAHPDPLEPRPVLATAIGSDPLARALPASSLAAGQAPNLARTAARDRLVASAIEAEANEARAPVAAGSEGEYMVQVISYDRQANADAFAAGLRERGHHAFVQQAEVEGRGTMYRVRVGPFETAREARNYRREFEERERMNTLVVRRPSEPS